MWRAPARSVQAHSEAARTVVHHATAHDVRVRPWQATCNTRGRSNLSGCHGPDYGRSFNLNQAKCLKAKSTSFFARARARVCVCVCVCVFGSAHATMRRPCARVCVCVCNILCVTYVRHVCALSVFAVRSRFKSAGPQQTSTLSAQSGRCQ